MPSRQLRASPPASSGPMRSIRPSPAHRAPPIPTAAPTARVFGTFLTWLSEKTVPVFVIATANDISSLPPELLRKGRLDEIFFVDLPTAAEREQIFRIHLTKRRRRMEDFELSRLVATSDGFSGAEIEEAIISALFDVFSSGSDLSTADVVRSLQETVPLSKTMSEEIGRLRHWAQGRARVASGEVAQTDSADDVRRKIESSKQINRPAATRSAQMSSVIVVSPIIIATWPVIAHAIAGVVTSIGFSVLRESDQQSGLGTFHNTDG